MNFISLFSGGGGADIGAMMAGYTPVAANEYDPAIAEVYRANIGNHIRVGDILTQDLHDYPACDLLHMSPPCPNFSAAKAGASETEHDIALAEKCAEFIRVLSPRSVTVENVTAYRDSQSYQIILRAITDGRYMYDAEVLNSADYGVPQTRRRFVVRATRGLLRPMPAPGRWIGWYEAIEDLIDTLPASEFSPWQLARLPEELSDCALVSRNEMRSRVERGREEPAQTIMALSSGNSHQTGGMPRAFIIPAGGHSEDGGGLPGANSRAWLSTGRVVKMTPRALARLQSFPDDYKLPRRNSERRILPIEKRWYENLTSGVLTPRHQELINEWLMTNDSLSCKISGNACPPLMMRAVFETLL